MSGGSRSRNRAKGARRIVDLGICPAMGLPSEGVNLETRCIKAAYRSESEAERHARGRARRAYHCPLCGKWHLTKRERWSNEV